MPPDLTASGRGRSLTGKWRNRATLLDPEILKRYDTEIAERFLKTPGALLTALSKYLGIDIVEVALGTLRAEMTVLEEIRTPFGNIPGCVLAVVCDHVLG